MLPLSALPVASAKRLRGVLTDIDDTLTSDGRLTAEAYGAMAALQAAGLWVIPITGRPAGWCDHIARMWPVDAVVGENGAFYFAYDHARRCFTQQYLQNAETRAASRAKLADLQVRILSQVPGSALASDQAYRVADLAIDHCEDVAPLSAAAVSEIVALFEAAGAKAKVSSIHVNGWFGDYDKLTMTRILMRERFQLDLDGVEAEFVFVGDSPNDAPLFDYFSQSVGVANVRAFEAQLDAAPTYVTDGRGGAGFAELAGFIIAAREA